LEQKYQMKTGMARVWIKSIFIFCIAFLSVTQYIFSQQWPSHINQYKRDIGILASDSLQGRYPGTLGDTIASRYIYNRFISAGLNLDKPLGIQSFPIRTGVKPGDENTLSTPSQSFDYAIDFIPAGFSASTMLNAPVEYCGYGYSINSKNLSHDDYTNLQLTGKWALIFEGNPFDSIAAYRHNSGNREKVYTAVDKGAAGVILIARAGESLVFDSLNLSQVSIPVIIISRKTADILLAPDGVTSAQLDESYHKSGMEQTFKISQNLNARCKIEPVFCNTNNIVAELCHQPGNKYIVIGAHYDHLGMGGPATSSRTPEVPAVHSGADDNASGIAGIIALAETLSTISENLNYNFLFVAFGAEEKGLLGSKYFVENLPVPAENIAMMINLDMIGRMKPDSSLQIGGAGTATEFGSLIEIIEKKHRYKLQISNEGYGPSDHASFYAQGIPVLYFSTGAHTDYHTPGDSPDKINYSGIDACLTIVYDFIMELNSNYQLLHFSEAGPKNPEASRHGGKKVSLGIMPDVANTEIRGLRAEAVTPGKPAYLGGMLAGDIITAIDGKTVSDIREYMYRLNQLEPGDTVLVDVERNGEKIVLIIKL